MNTFPTPVVKSDAAAASAAISAAGQYLFFYLGREEYGIQVARISEIISLIPLQLAPGLPYYVRGVVSILGQTIPIVDLRLKLGLPEPAPANRALEKGPDSTWVASEYSGPASDPGQYPGPGCIVMIDTGTGRLGTSRDGRANQGQAETGRSFGGPPIECNFVGIIADCISEIVSIQPEDIEPAPSPAGPSTLSCILGRARVGSKIKILLDIDLALNSD